MCCSSTETVGSDMCETKSEDEDARTQVWRSVATWGLMRECPVERAACKESDGDECFQVVQYVGCSCIVLSRLAKNRP